MKKISKNPKKVVKGGSSGLVISIAVHAAAFFLAGLLVVFTVQNKEEIAFEPPQPVERPKMKLKKPKVKVKKNTKPKSSSRIVTKVNRASMPDIQLPEMSGMGDGLAGGVGGGFELAPDLGDLASAFGDKFTTGNDLKGYFYNLNRDRGGRKIPMSPDQMQDVVYGFMKAGWRPSKLARYYRSPTEIYTPTICIPTVMSELAPQAFGETEAEGYCWLVVYEGELVYPEDITFRFWGVGDKLMSVQVDGETVLFCAYHNTVRERFANLWTTSDPKDNTYYFGEHRARPSDWITLRAGEPQKIRVLMGDLMGGLVYHILSVEVKGEEYPNTREGGGPTFPVFRTSEIPDAVRDIIYSDLYEGDTVLTNGPIFRDFASKGATRPAEEPEPVEEPEPEADVWADRGAWTLADGRSFEGEFVTLLGRTLVFKDPRGRNVKVPVDELNPADRVHLELAHPPEFDINFVKSSAQVPNPELSPWLSGNQRPLQIFEYKFGVQVKQKTVNVSYDHELEVEYFAVGEEVDGDNFVLLERKSASYVPARRGKDAFEFRGGPVRMRRMAYRDTAPVRGTKYGGYLVTLTDARGKVIQHKASHEFLYENIGKLRKLRVNNHFDKHVDRTTPARPTADSRGKGAVDGN